MKGEKYVKHLELGMTQHKCSIDVSCGWWWGCGEGWELHERCDAQRVPQRDTWNLYTFFSSYSVSYPGSAATPAHTISDCYQHPLRATSDCGHTHTHILFRGSLGLPWGLLIRAQDASGTRVSPSWQSWICPRSSAQDHGGHMEHPQGTGAAAEAVLYPSQSKFLHRPPPPPHIQSLPPELSGESWLLHSRGNECPDATQWP